MSLGIWPTPPEALPSSAAAFSQLGVPQWGGTTPGVGLTARGSRNGVLSPGRDIDTRNSEDQAAAGTKVPLSMAEPGDVPLAARHVAIYIGDDSYIHESPQTGDVCARCRRNQLLHLRSQVRIRRMET